MSTSGDAYSYSIILLELLTGKRPTNNLFKDGMSLPKFVEAGDTFEQNMDIIRPNMPSDVPGDDVTDDNPTRINECLVSVLNVGLASSDP